MRMEDGLVSDVIFDAKTFQYKDGHANGNIVGVLVNQGDETTPKYCMDVRNSNEYRYPPYKVHNFECEVTNHTGFMIYDVADKIIIDRAMELWADNGFKFDNISSIKIQPFSGILNNTGFYKNILTELPHINQHITSIEGGILSGELDGKFDISKESDGIVKIAYYDVDGSDMTKLTDLEHLSEDFENLHEMFLNKIEDREIILSTDDLPTAGNDMTL